MNDTLLSVRNLHTYFFVGSAVSKAVEGAEFNIRLGETLGLVGESGCGKTVTSLSIMRLIPSPPGKIVYGSILFDGRDLLTLAEEHMRRVRGGEIGMVFQEPMASLNPVYSIGYQIAEVILAHTPTPRQEVRDKCIELLSSVGMPEAERQLDRYPHELSGGLRQRAMIAMAIACGPKLLIADEPTTALDVTIQAQILELFQELKSSRAMSVLLVTHNLAVVAEVSDSVAVMYSGRIVEYASTAELFTNPIHPYTAGLLSSVPSVHRKVEHLEVIPGNVADPSNKPRGCPFHPRCKLATKECSAEMPPVERLDSAHWFRCWNALKSRS